MGGGQKVKQTNPAQAAAANAGATAAANNATALSNQFSGQQQQLYNNLWGTPGSGGGAVGSMLDPSKLNVSSPTGPYGLMFTQQKEQLAKGYQNADAATKRSLSQSGFNPSSTPSGFAADLSAQNARALADSTGSAYSTATQNSYQDALNNFWKAADLASSGSTAAGQGALSGNATANNTYTNLYGTAGHGNVVQSSNFLSPILGAAGTVGAAAMGPGGIATQAASPACCAQGTRVRTGLKEFTPIEQLFEGAKIYGLREHDEDPLVIWRPLEYALRPCVQVKTDGGQELICSTDHTLLMTGGGYVRADELLNHSVRTRDGSVKVIEVKPVGERRVVRLHLDPPHVFESNGLLSEE